MTRKEMVKALRCASSEGHCPQTECDASCSFWQDDSVTIRIRDTSDLLWFAADMLEQDTQTWISVKDRLPPEKHYGPTPDIGFTCSDACLVAADICGIDYTVAQDWTIDGTWRRYDCYVTHWMPMPCPPELLKEEQT